MDLIIIVLLILVIGFVFRDFKSVVYLFGILEIFFRLLHQIALKLNVPAFTTFINNYIPSSLSALLDKYADGLLFEVLEWLLIIIFIWFLVYLVEYFIHKKK